MTNKRFGRVGDSPLIGAGTYADNRDLRRLRTGHGEYFMRLVIGHEIAAQMRYRAQERRRGRDDVFLRQLAAMDGTGGVIAIDRSGAIAMPFNTSGMYRASIDVNGKLAGGDLPGVASRFREIVAGSTARRPEG
jgi:beta-aspartyl-peptidase (threonine type)